MKTDVLESEDCGMFLNATRQGVQKLFFHLDVSPLCWVGLKPSEKKSFSTHLITPLQHHITLLQKVERRSRSLNELTLSCNHVSPFSPGNSQRDQSILQLSQMSLKSIFCHLTRPKHGEQNEQVVSVLYCSTDGNSDYFHATISNGLTVEIQRWMWKLLFTDLLLHDRQSQIHFGSLAELFFFFH